MRLSLPVLHDPILETFGRYSPGGWPACVFIDRNLKVKGVVLGARSDLTADIAQHLGAVPTDQPPSIRVGFKAPRRVTELSSPSGVVALDTPGVVAVADEGHNRIILGIVDATAGSFSATSVIDGVQSPGRMAALPGGMLAATQPDEGKVLLVDTAARSVHPVAQGLQRPTGVCLDVDGSLVVADAGADRLYRIATANVVARTLSSPEPIAGSGFTGQNDGPSHRATLSQPTSVCRTTTGVLFTDSASNNIRLLTDKGRVHSVTGNSPTLHGLTDGAVHSARLSRPVDIVGSHDGSLVIVDHENHRIRRLIDGSISTVGANGLADPDAAAVLSDGTILVADTGNHRLVHIDTENRQAQGLRVEGMERTLSLGAAPTVRGNAGMTLQLGYPSPGSGPWEIEVKSEPSSLLAGPLRVVREEPGGEIVVNLDQPGRGILTVTSTSSGVERSIRLPLEVR